MSGYSSSVRDVPDSEKEAVYARYHVVHVPYAHEVDHLVSLELGGVQLHPEPLARAVRRPVGSPDEDETYVKVAGRWAYLYRAIDQCGQVVDVLLSSRGDLETSSTSSSSQGGRAPTRRPGRPCRC